MQIGLFAHRRTGVLTGALFLSCALAACSHDQKSVQKKVQTVTVETVKTVPYAQSSSMPGRATSFLTSPVTPQVTGVIQKRLFTEGSVVREGQVLYQIDPAPYQATYDADKAELEKAQAALLSAKPIAERDRSLAAIDAISKETLEEAEATLKQDEATIDADKAALESARINLGYTRVTAPVTGTISASAYTPGALVTADQTTALATIYAYDPMYLDVTESSTDVLALRKKFASGEYKTDANGNAKVKITLEDGTTYAHEGTLQFAGVGVDQTTGTITLRVIVPNPEKLLLPGEYLHAVVDQGVNQSAILVPQQAVVHDQRGNATALVVDAQNKIESRTLMLAGTANNNEWVVTGGLATGDRIVVAGSQFVSVGDTVKATEATEATDATEATEAAAASSPSSSPSAN
ncbi:efflux RND transporter periplasmic adaptor subunit [Paraburkholderia tropica]|uniref:Membrane fusion protein, multidrug efflux system/membrane fusion protein, multidrug efflux system n=1 Tax=Paraburkholderia tropica TaxID=92647 RepID=A0AAQ1GK18_9BURK|nr:efflux RND transporter periplasmic adaptor subunit [Paraburkholderia tropica]RQN38524.1 efflux RND transporter periplasmic adaptor subunit [Paraburkholderia tropica]SEK07084.1 membrane fusion protein, multidrug efflux system/membrane fusion protein, multidrug efflux system [Paraburkholderia tropica]